MKTKLKDTKVGQFLKTKAPKILDVIGDVLPDSGSLGIVKNLISQDPDLTPEEKAQLHAQIVEVYKLEEISKQKNDHENRIRSLEKKFWTSLAIFGASMGTFLEAIFGK